MRVASATVSAPLTANPRRSIASISRCRKARSSSTIRSDLPPPGAMPVEVSSFIANSRLQIFGPGAIPVDGHAGPAGAAIAEAHDRAEAPQQSLGNEEAEAHMAALALACGNIGFAEAIEQ